MTKSEAMKKDKHIDFEHEIHKLANEYGVSSTLAGQIAYGNVNYYIFSGYDASLAIRKAIEETRKELEIIKMKGYA